MTGEQSHLQGGPGEVPPTGREASFLPPAGAPSGPAAATTPHFAAASGSHAGPGPYAGPGHAGPGPHAGGGGPAGTGPDALPRYPAGGTLMAQAPPTAPWEPPKSGGFRDFMRQKQAQVIAAGLIGLMVGGLVGGLTVAMASGPADRPDQSATWDSPRWDRDPEWDRPPELDREPNLERDPGGPADPSPGAPGCRKVQGETFCHQEMPLETPGPRPSKSLSPTPGPTLTG
ncbi:hypothetical protein [Nonomuraea lactucae]|uniref:hypothetical protein n=1 Tax=Nonomuraea lactucae TaxID=2249762 RepID=UPI0013B457A6|nr:hypothetical protein [Nonomuraea lactucae]